MKNTMIPEIASVCGLYCGACGIYLATQSNDTEKLSRYATMLGQPLSETRCDGCRSGCKTAYCNNCYMMKCSREKNLNFCGECNEYPCEELKNFQQQMPHRAELWKAQSRIAEIGAVEWTAEMKTYFSCPQCHTGSTSYDLKCPKCGHVPGNGFVGNNRETVMTYLENRKNS
ncbi:MAG: DUF3795 domain-containing protein [Bacteroidales bacterium]|nr:DUF3795 domain-containing protein [Bacteroidales bacterium]